MAALVYGVERDGFIRAMHSLEQDIYSLCNWGHNPFMPQNIDVAIPVWNIEDFVGFTYGLFNRSRLVMQEAPDQKAPLRTKFGKALKAAAQLTGLSLEVGNSDFCLEAEPRLMRSLGYSAKACNRIMLSD